MATKSKRDPVETVWQAIEHVPLGLVALDGARRIRRINTTLCGWLGYTADELLGRRFLDLVPARWHQPFRTRCRQGCDSPAVRMQITCSDGRSARFELRVCPVARSATAIAGGLQLIVSARESPARTRSRTAPGDTDARLRELVQRLSHLRSIEARSLAATLGDCVGRELAELRGGLNRLALPGATAPRQAALLRNMLSRIERAQEQLRRLRFELAPPGAAELGLVPALQRRADEFAARTGLIVSCALDSLPGHLPARAQTLLEQALEEALHNVERHAGAHRVEISADVRGHWAVLQVRDDGTGLVESDRRQPRRLGLLGLEVCLAEIGGTLQVVGRSGRGTTLVAAVPTRTRRASKRRVIEATD